MTITAGHTTALTPSATLGRRAGARILTGLLVSLGAYAPMWLGVLLLDRAGQAGAILGSGLSLGFMVLILVNVFRKGQTPGYQALQLQVRDAVTGGPAGGKLFGRLLLQSLVSGISLGLAEPIVSLASYRDGRTWFDRTTGTIVVDLRGADEAAATAQVPPAGERGASDPLIAHVRLDALPVAQAPVQDLTTLVGPEPSFEPVAPPPNPPAQVLPFGPVYQAEQAVVDPAPIVTGNPFAPPGRPPAAPFSPPTPAVPPGFQPASYAPWSPPVPPPPVVTPEAAPTSGSLVDDHTVLDAEVHAAPVLRFDDGSIVVVHGAVALGRDPKAPATHPFATTLAVHDPALRVSKTHLVVTASADAVWVTDLGSTNGVKLQAPGSEPVRIVPNEATPVPRGTTVRFGGRSFEVTP